MSAQLPSLIAPAIDIVSGRFTAAWVGFFRSLGTQPGPIADVPRTGSGMVYTASGAGSLVVTGGAGVTLALIRGRVGIAVPAGGPLPLASGDEVRIGYTAAPEISFVPGVL